MKKIELLAVVTEELNVGDLCVCDIDPTSGSMRVKKATMKDSIKINKPNIIERIINFFTT